MSSIFRMVKRKVALAFADTSGHGNSDDNKMTARRPRRGNIQKRSDPSDVTDSDSDDDIDFVDEIQMVKSSAATSMKAERSQRQQQRHEAKTQNRQDDKQSHVDDLRQREEEELMRAIELSKLDMEVDKSRSDSGDELITGDESTLEPQQHFNKKHTLQLTRKSLSRKGSRAADGPSERHGLHEDKPSSSSGNSTPNEMEPASQERFNEWQDEMESTDWEDPSQQQGVDNSDGSSPSFCMKRTDSVERRGKINNSQAETGRHQYAEEISQPKEKLPLELRSRLRLRKHPVQGSSQPGLPFKTKKVPPPPDIDESDDEDGDEQSPEEIDMTKDEEGSSGEEEDTPEETEDGRQDLEIIKLVDTRKPRLPKHPYYAPLNSNKYTYTKVVYKLIQAYCSRLRRAQTKALTRVRWGHQVVTGNCFSDTLVFRKRGSKGLAFYTLSDSDEEEMAVADNQEKEGTSYTPVKTRLERGKKKINFLDDDDSDFDDSIPVKRNKMSTKGRQRLSSPDVLEMLKMKSQHLQEREEDLIVPDDEETLSQTLVHDQSQTQDYSPVQKEASEYDSDRSQPTIRTAPKSQLNPSADSQNSITDIFKVSTNDDETDEHQASESPSKNTDGRKHRRASTQGSEEDDNVDSFDEQLMSLSSLNTLSGPPKAVTPTVKNHSQSSNHATPQELLSTNHSKIRNFKQEDHEENELNSEKSVISSVPADSSQHCEPSQENLRTDESRDREFKVELYDAHGPSFEEKRFIYFGETLASSEPDKMEKSSHEEMPEDGGGDGVSEEGQEISQSEVNKNVQIATPEKFLRRQRSRQQKRLSRATNSGGSLPPESQQLPTNNLSAFRPHRASVESTKQKVGRSKTECFNVDEEREEDWDGEQTERDRSDEEGVQDEDGVEAGEEEVVEDGGDDDSDSDVTCMDEQENIRDDISEPPQDGDQIDGDRTEGDGEGLHEGRDEEGVIAGGDDAEVEDEVEEIGVECPLCGVQFPLDRIEAHASGCNGPVSPEPPPKENNRQENDVDSKEVPVRGWRAQHRPVRKGLVGSLTDSNSDDAPGPSTAAEPKRRSQVRNTKEGGRPKILKEKSSGSISSKQEFISSSQSPNEQRSTPIFEEDASESFSESNDHLNATLFQLVEDNNLFQRKRTRVQERPAKRQRLQDQNKHVETSTSVEDTEPCFICKKRIPKSLYAQHVQDEIDHNEEERHSQDAVQPRRGLRSKKAIAKAAGGETSTDIEKFQSGPSNDVGDLIEDCPSGDWEQDSESDGSSFASDDPILDPMVSESPIKAFRPINKQPMNLINFKNQFQNNVSGSRKRHRSTTSSNRGRGQGSRGGGRKQRGKKRRRFPRKK